MSGFEEKLNAILSDPDAMAQVMQLAQSLHLDEPASDGSSDEAQGEERPPAGEAEPAANPLGGLSDLLGEIDPGMIRRLLPLLGELRGGGEQDRRLELLNALRPFLKPERQAKVERAVKAARLLHLGKKLLSAMGEPHV